MKEIAEYEFIKVMLWTAVKFMCFLGCFLDSKRSRKRIKMFVDL